MAPGYIETPYDFADKHWYTADGAPRTIRATAPRSAEAYPAATTSSYTHDSRRHTKPYRTNDEYNYNYSYGYDDRVYEYGHDFPGSAELDSKNLREAYKCLPSLDYEYRAPPKPKAQPKVKHAAGGRQGVASVNGSSGRNSEYARRAGTHLAALDPRPGNSISSHSRAHAASHRTSYNGSARRNRDSQNIPPTRAPWTDEPAPPRYEYEYHTEAPLRHHRAHAAPVYETLPRVVNRATPSVRPRTTNSAKRRSAANISQSMAALEAVYDHRPGASWYRPTPSSESKAPATLREGNQGNKQAKEGSSWYRPRQQEVASKDRVLRRSKGHVNRASAARNSMIVAKPAQSSEGGVKRWYAGVRWRLFRKRAKV